MTPAADPATDMDAPLFSFSDHVQDSFTLRQAAEGVVLFGGIGSGKTTGSGRTLARSFLDAGLGGLVMCAKPEEAEDWQFYADEAGRGDDVILFDQSGRYGFDFLRYELGRPGRGAGYTENIVRLFTNIAEAVQGSRLGQGENAYWLMAMQQMLRNAVDLLVTARGTVTVPLLQQVVRDAPRSVDEIYSAGWAERSLVNQLINEGAAKQAEIESGPDGKWRYLDFTAAATYFMQEYPGFGERLRSSIVNQFTSIADLFTRRPFRQLFCSRSNIVPEMTRDGKIIILDLPVKEFGAAGRAAQVMFKFMWQQAVERDGASDNNLPFVFLWADEAQNFVSEYDSMFQATARSSRACTVYITQNLPNFYANMGGQDAKSRVDTLVGNFATKIWHANSDPQTNEHAAQVIGKAWQAIQGSNFSTSQEGGSFGGNTAQVLEFEVLPQRFTRLAKGGPPYSWQVEGVVFQSGRIWKATGKTFLTTFFNNEV